MPFGYDRTDGQGLVGNDAKIFDEVVDQVKTGDIREDVQDEALEVVAHMCLFSREIIF